MKRLLLASLVPAVLIFSGPVRADIYAFVDSNGVRHLSNVPNDPRYKLVMRTPAYRKSAAQSSSFAPANLYSASIPSARRYYSRPIAPLAPRRVNEQNRQRFAGDVDRIAAQHRLEPALLHAVISAESSYNPWAVSPKGAMGLMQLMPGTAERFGVRNPYDPVSNMYGGARYLRWLLDQFNDTRLAVAAYNAGEGAVQKYGNQIPPYRETQTYVVRVLDFYQRYKGGGALYNTAYSTPIASNTAFTYNNASVGNRSLYSNRSSGVTIISPRVSASRPSTGSAAISSTYLTPTGTRIIVGNSNSALVSSKPRRPTVVYSSTPLRTTPPSNASSFFIANDK